MDSFNRADNVNSPGWTETAQPWVVTSGSVWGITGNRLKLMSGIGRCLISFSAPNIRMQTTLLGDLVNQRIIFRYVDDNNEWFINGNAIAKRVDSTVTAVATMSATPKDGDQIIIHIRNQTLTVLLNGTQVVNYTEPSLQSNNGRIYGYGHQSYSAATLGYFDQFSLEEI
ncbi:hypothetical protein MHB81_19275 [Paenibacillus sp. FSL H7-0326]